MSASGTVSMPTVATRLAAELARSALPAGLKINRSVDPIPYVGACLGTVWTQPIGDDLAVLLIADTPQIRAKLAHVGIYMQEVAP